MSQVHSRRMFVGGAAASTAAALLPVTARARQGENAGKEIQIAAADGKFGSYFSAPDKGKGPVVVLVSSIFGVDGDIKDMCDELAGRSCVALAPNFFWRDQDPGVLSLSTDAPRAFARVGRLDFEKSMDDLKRAIAEAKRHPSSNGKVAILGFCFGGPHAWRAACDGLGVGAALSFHGTFVSRYMKPGDKPACPVAFHYGDKDELAPPAELAAVKKVADATGSEFVVYPGVGHGYMMKSAPGGHGEHGGHGGYNAEAFRKSWDRALQMIDALKA